MNNLVSLPKPPDPFSTDVCNLLEDLLVKAREGKIKHIAVVYDRSDDKWASTSSYTDDTRIVGAMLIELGLRNLGFKADQNGY